MKKYIISGEKGKVGKELLPLFIQKNYSISTYDNNRNIKADCFIHIAAKSDSKTSDFKNIVDSNINLLIEVIDYCKKNKIKNIVFFSAICIFGSKNKLNISEEDIEVSPNTLYAASKILGEQIFEHSGLNILTFRLPSVLTNVKNDGVLFRILEGLQNNTDISITNYNKLFNNFITVHDIFNFIINYDFKKKNVLLLLAKEQELSLKEIVEYMKEETNSHSKIILHDSTNSFFNISIKKAKTYGFIPINVKDSLKAWIKEQK